MTTLSIMLIEDNVSIRNAYKRSIKEQALEEKINTDIEAFQTLDSAVRRLLDEKQSTSFDLIFTDIDLTGDPKPDKAGITFARFVKKNQPDIPIIGCSGYFADTDLTEEEKSLFDRWWPKGSSITELKEMIKDTVQRAILSSKEKQKRAASINFPDNENTHALKVETHDYQQKTIVPTEENGFLKPFTVFVWESEDGCELEVMSCPALIAWGDDYSQAVEVLEELCQGYKELLDTPDELMSPNMLQARNFLKQIFIS